jgi:hypothetical protein
MGKAKNDLTQILKRLDKSVKDATQPIVLKDVGKFTLDLVVKRTRLGYGVDKNFGKREKLGPLKDTYIEKRKKSTYDNPLDSTTRPSKSNLTKTGEMLRSMDYTVKEGKIIIEPSDPDNLLLAEYNAEAVTYANGYTKPARVFNRVSELEFQQILRMYRKAFTNLLKKLQLVK